LSSIRVCFPLSLFRGPFATGYRAKLLLGRRKAIKVLHHGLPRRSGGVCIRRTLSGEQLLHVGLLLLHEVFEPFTSLGVHD